jgi:hypothetical protein
MLPAGEKIVLVLEAIGDDKINSSSLDHPLTILPDQAIEIVGTHAIVGKDGNPIALAHAKFMKSARVTLHRRYGIGETERDAAIDPTQCDR